jgi:hypothetical protein
VTRLPRFLEKARQFPGAWFAVGTDTLVRILDADYYGSAEARDAALRELAELGTRFVVFGREIDGRFVTLSDLDVPAELQARCVEVSREEFDEPVSSTALRRT